MDADIFDADFLQRLRTLFFKLKRRRQLRKKGVQQTRAAGFTREFKDHRHYTKSDDFRLIDWRLFARERGRQSAGASHESPMGAQGRCAREALVHAECLCGRRVVDTCDSSAWRELCHQVRPR